MCWRELLSLEITAVEICLLMDIMELDGTWLVVLKVVKHTDVTLHLLDVWAATSDISQTLQLTPKQSRWTDRTVRGRLESIYHLLIDVLLWIPLNFLQELPLFHL